MSWYSPTVLGNLNRSNASLSVILSIDCVLFKRAYLGLFSSEFSPICTIGPYLPSLAYTFSFVLGSTPSSLSPLALGENANAFSTAR